MGNSPACPYISFHKVCCLSSKTMCWCLYALIHINYFTTRAVSPSRCLEIRFQCQLRDENHRAFPPRLFSHPVSSTQWLKPKPSHLNNTEIQAYTSNVFLLHQQVNFFPHNSSSVSNYVECLWGNKGGEVKPLCASLLVEHMEDLDSWKLGEQKWRHPHSESETKSVPWMNFLFQSATDIGFLQPGHTQEVSHTYLPVVCTLQTLPAPWVTGRGGGQISFWNFNLLQLNYLISEPPTSMEYLSSLLPGCLDGRLSLPSPEGLTHFISLPCGLNDASLKSYSAPWNQRYTALINRSAFRALVAGGTIIVWNFNFVTMYSHNLIFDSPSNCKTIFLAAERNLFRLRGKERKQLLWFAMERKYKSLIEICITSLCNK